jgi:hypothetical protein
VLLISTIIGETRIAYRADDPAAASVIATAMTRHLARREKSDPDIFKNPLKRGASAVTEEGGRSLFPLPALFGFPDAYEAASVTVIVSL